MALLLRAASRLVVLLALACEVSSPPPREPGASPEPRGTAAPQRPELVAAPEEPAAPAEPAWLTADGLAYREVMLGGAEPEQRLPMIVAIHGLGDGPDNFRHLLDGFTEPARLILPRAPDPVPAGGWSWFPIRARDPDVATLSAEVASAAERVAAGIHALEQSRPTVGKPIVTGFSQGGMLTFVLAVQHPDVVGYAIAVGGWLPPPLVPTPAKGTKYPPLLALHGTADAAVPFLPTQQSVKTLVERGLEAELIEYDGVGHMIPELMRRDLYDRLTDAVQQEHQRPSP